MELRVPISRLHGTWKTPPGWRAQWYWTGDVTITDRGRFPNLVLCRLPKDVREAQTHGWTPALEMPLEVKRLALDYYGSDLTAEQRVIFAAAVPGWLEAQRPKKAPAKAKAPAKKARKR